MICPYNRVKTMGWNTVETTNEGTLVTTKYSEDYIMLKCPKEECGAWQDNKCNYASQA